MGGRAPGAPPLDPPMLFNRGESFPTFGAFPNTLCVQAPPGMGRQLQ